LVKNNTCPITVLFQHAKENVISDMDIDDLRKCFEMILNGLDRALNFINENNDTMSRK